jgi:hypothetical protein
MCVLVVLTTGTKLGGLLLYQLVSCTKQHRKQCKRRRPELQLGFGWRSWSSLSVRRTSKITVPLSTGRAWQVKLHTNSTPRVSEVSNEHHA